jgi:soluble lytic murein transglycosylase-like protein
MILREKTIPGPDSGPQDTPPVRTCAHRRLRWALRSVVLALALLGMVTTSPLPLGAARQSADSGPSTPQHALGVLYQAVSACRSSLPESRRWEIADAIERESRRHGFDPLFVQALVEVESTCLPTARSNRGARGLVQVKPATGREVAERAGLEWDGPEDLYDPRFNVRIGLLYLSYLQERLGDPRAAIAAYNLGPSRARRMGLERVRDHGYVRRVLGRYDDLVEAHAPSDADRT